MFLDTSAVIEFFIGTKRGEGVSEAIKEEDCFVSILTYAEAAVWCRRNGRDFELWKEKLERIANVVEVTHGICAEGARITCETKEKETSFGIIDGIILASARSIGQTLTTKDGHFRDFDDAIII